MVLEAYINISKFSVYGNLMVHLGFKANIGDSVQYNKKPILKNVRVKIFYNIGRDYYLLEGKLK